MVVGFRNITSAMQNQMEQKVEHTITFLVRPWGQLFIDYIQRSGQVGFKPSRVEVTIENQMGKQTDSDMEP